MQNLALTFRAVSSFALCFAKVACALPLEASMVALASLRSADSDANSRPEAALCNNSGATHMRESTSLSYLVAS